MPEGMILSRKSVESRYNWRSRRAMAAVVTKFPLLPDEARMRRRLAGAINGSSSLKKSGPWCERGERGTAGDKSLPPISPGTSGEDGGVTSGYHSEAAEVRQSCSSHPLPSSPPLPATTAVVAEEGHGRGNQSNGERSQNTTSYQMTRSDLATQKSRQLMKQRRDQHVRQVQVLTAESQERRRRQLQQERLRWGDRGIGCSRLWQPSTRDDDLPAHSQAGIPGWVQRAGSDGSTVEVTDRSPSAVSCQSQRSHHDSHPLLPHESVRQCAPNTGTSTNPALCWATDSEQVQAEYKRHAALQILRINQQQAAEKRQRARIERQQLAREEAAALQYMQREQLRLQQAEEKQRHQLTARLQALERRQQSVLEAVERASQQAALDRHRRLQCSRGPPDPQPNGEEDERPLRHSSRSQQNISVGSDGLRVDSVRSCSAEHLTNEPNDSDSKKEVVESSVHPVYTTECTLSGTSHQVHSCVDGREVATQTDVDSQPWMTTSRTNALLTSRLTCDVKVGTDRQNKNSCSTKSSKTLEVRPRWNAPKKDKLYMTQSEKDVTVNRRCRRRGMRRILRTEDTASDTDTDSRSRLLPARLRNKYSRNSYPEAALYPRLHHQSQPGNMDLLPYPIPLWQYPHTACTYPPSLPHHQHLHHYHQQHREQEEFQQYGLQRHGYLHPSPILPPVTRCRSLPRMHYPFVSTERALCDVTGAVYNASSDLAHQTSPVWRSYGRRDNGTDKEDEEPPLLLTPQLPERTNTRSRHTDVDSGGPLCDTQSDFSPDTTTTTSTTPSKASPETATSSSPPAVPGAKSVRKQLSKLKNGLLKSRRQESRDKKIMEADIN